MPRETLDREIHQLQDEILTLGSLVEQNMIDAMQALRSRDKAETQRVFQVDTIVNQKRFAIESATLLVIATQQPMAHDLRQLAAILEVANELERIGDYAKGIAKINILLEFEDISAPLRDLEKMAEIAVNMLHRSLTAFISEDIELARAIPADDDLVDDLYKTVYRKLVAVMIANPDIIDHANYYLWAAHNLERSADRVSNICERTIFVVTGELLEVASNDQDIMESGALN
jgi:phosphate transport system protein